MKQAQIITGTYTCVASTRTGTATDSGTLTVEGIPPTLIDGPTEMTVVEGSDVEILCRVSGYPKPSHIWYKVRHNCYNINCCLLRAG